MSEYVAEVKISVISEGVWERLNTLDISGFEYLDEIKEDFASRLCVGDLYDLSKDKLFWETIEGLTVLVNMISEALGGDGIVFGYSEHVDLTPGKCTVVYYLGEKVKVIEDIPKILVKANNADLWLRRFGAELEKRELGFSESEKARMLECGIDINSEKFGVYVIPDGTRVIEHGDISNRDMSSVSMPKSLRVIGHGAFEKCENLTEVDIPEGVVKIRREAFSGCLNLKRITLPSTVKEIVGNAFGSHSLERIDVSEDNPYFCSVDGVLCKRSDSGAEMLVFPCGRSEAVFPDGIKVIGEHVFSGCHKLKSVIVPSGVEVIESAAFFNCEQLESAVIPDSVKSIGGYAFGECKKLKNVVLPEGLEIDLNSVFYHTPWLREKRKKDPFGIVNSILISGSYCQGKVIIPKNVAEIGDNAFRGVYDVTRVLMYYNNLTKIGRAAFEKCYDLKEVELPRSVTEIGPLAFAYCTYIMEMFFPQELEKIADCMMLECRDLESVYLGDKVTEIGNLAFADCKSLKTISLPKSLTTIGYMAFRNCKSLEELKIPDSVTRIRTHAFYNCGRLTVTYKGKTYTSENFNELYT